MDKPMLDELAGQDAHTTMLMLTSVRVHELTRDYLVTLRTRVAFCNLMRLLLIEAFVWSGAAPFLGWLRQLSKPSKPPAPSGTVPPPARRPQGQEGPYRSPSYPVGPAPAAAPPRGWRLIVLLLVAAWVAFGAADVSFHAVRLRG